MAKKAVMLIHGFTENCEETFSKFLENTKFRGYDIKKYHILGHDPEKPDEEFEFENELIRANVYCNSLIEHYEEVSIVGFSLGGALAGYLASRHNIKRLVMIAPAYKYLNSTEISKTFIDSAKEVLKAKSLKEGIEKFIADKVKADSSIYTRYDKLDKHLHNDIYNFIKIIDRIRDDIKEITCPTLILHGEKDELVPISSSLYIYNKISSNNKLLVIVPNSFHRVFSHNDSIRYHTMAQDFVKRGKIKWKTKL